MQTLPEDVPAKPLAPAQWRMIYLALAIAFAGLAYRIILHGHLEQSALLFIGIPTLLAILLATTGPARTLVGGTIRGICFFLLLSGPLLGEGFICILMAAPIFLLVGIVIAAIVTRFRTKPSGAALGCLALFLPMCLEGVTPELSFNRLQTVTQAAIVDGSPAEVQNRLAHSPQLALRTPGLLWRGFPRPIAASGDGLNPGDERRIRFAGGEGAPGDLVLRILQADPASIRFEAVSDQSKIAHWLTWRTAEVSWQPIPIGPKAPPRTRVTWTFTYERRLDPAWYFAPWERYAVATAAQYLIATNAGPR